MNDSIFLIFKIFCIFLMSNLDSILRIHSLFALYSVSRNVNIVFIIDIYSINACKKIQFLIFKSASWLFVNALNMIILTMWFCDLILKILFNCLKRWTFRIWACNRFLDKKDNSHHLKIDFISINSTKVFFSFSCFKCCFS